MNPREALNMQEVVGTFLFANVPAYLYGTYRRSDSVTNFARAYSTREIREAFDSLYSRVNRKGEDTALLYCLITALSLKNFSEVKGFFQSLDRTDLQWGADMKRLFFKRTTPDFESEIGTASITELK